MQVKKQQIEWDIEQQTGLKLGKEYIKAVYCQPAYLTYNQSSCEIQKLESRLQEEISITLDTQMTPPLWKKQIGTKEPLDENKNRVKKLA